LAGGWETCRRKKRLSSAEQRACMVKREVPEGGGRRGVRSRFKENREVQFLFGTRWEWVYFLFFCFFVLSAFFLGGRRGVRCRFKENREVFAERIHSEAHYSKTAHSETHFWMRVSRTFWKHIFWKRDRFRSMLMYCIWVASDSRIDTIIGLFCRI